MVTVNLYGYPMHIYRIMVTTVSVASIVCYVVVWICIRSRFGKQRSAAAILKAVEEGGGACHPSGNGL